LLDDVTAYSAVSVENSNKNSALDVIYSTFSGTLLVNSASGFNSLASGVYYSYIFIGVAPNRVLDVNVTNNSGVGVLSLAQSTQLETNLTTTLGSGSTQLNSGIVSTSGIVPTSGIAPGSGIVTSSGVGLFINII
jgi:hypothetical protein